MLLKLNFGGVQNEKFRKDGIRNYTIKNVMQVDNNILQITEESIYNGVDMQFE